MVGLGGLEPRHRPYQECDLRNIFAAIIGSVLPSTSTKSRQFVDVKRQLPNSRPFANDPHESPHYWLAERTWLGSHSVADLPVFISRSPLSKNGHA